MATSDPSQPAGGGRSFKDLLPDGVPADASPVGRPWLQVYFSCANAYQRVYRNVNGSGYLARCPKCGQSVRFRIGQGGTKQRFFEVSC